jgi:hypothetical protein
MTKFILSGLFSLSLYAKPPEAYPLSAQRRFQKAAWECQEKEGIDGIVYAAGGNHMPSPRFKPGTPRGIRSTVYIFELTDLNQVTRQGSSPYYTSVRTKLVRQAGTDSTGHFQVLLPPGSYSLFTKKGNLFYASRMDEKNNIAPVEVKPGKMTRVECRVESDHKPLY